MPIPGILRSLTAASALAALALGSAAAGAAEPESAPAVEPAPAETATADVEPAPACPPVDTAATCDPYCAKKVEDAKKAEEAKKKAEEEAKANKLLVSAMIKAGLMLTTGNSRSFSASGGVIFGLEKRAHKFGFEGGAAYMRTHMLVAIDDDPAGSPGAGTIEEDELIRDAKTASSAWFMKARYDYFFTKDKKYSAYGGAAIGGDKPAGKYIFGGVSAGFSYRALKTEKHEIVTEVGYDFSYEDYVDPTADPANIHSMRLFVGYTGKVSDWMGFYASVEGLFNLNKESVPTADGTNEATAFKDTRILGKVGISAKILKMLAINVGFTAKFDNVPAPMTAFEIPFAAGFLPMSEKFDTITDVQLVLTLL